MRTINVTTDIYAAIWAARLPGEDSEVDILDRILGVKKPEPKTETTPLPTKIGFSDPRFGLELPEGFEVFRIYRGTEFRAKARNGKWELPDGQSYPSLNQLSRGIGAGPENAWQNWYYTGSDGKRALISGLRKDT